MGDFLRVCRICPPSWTSKRLRARSWTITTGSRDAIGVDHPTLTTDSAVLGPGFRQDDSGSTLRLQNLEHAVGHGDDALVDGDLSAHENQASCRAYDTGPRHQQLADLARFDEMHVELG